MMAPKKTEASTKKTMNKGAWTAEEDRKLSEYVEIHGPKRWKTIANKAGLNRCGKSCRLRWLNYLRPNIKRGNISDDEEDMIVRLHKLLGNRWSLIAGRLPGRTDNEIKNYWNSHLSKKMTQKVHEITQEPSPALEYSPSPSELRESTAVRPVKEDETGLDKTASAISDVNFDMNELLDFTIEGSYGMEWVNKFLELDEDSWLSDSKKIEDDRGDEIK